MLNFMSRASKEANERQEYVRALIRRAKGKEENKPASKASRMLRFSPSTVYFLILEKDWWFCGFLTAVVYSVPVVAVGLLSMLLEQQRRREMAEEDSKNSLWSREPESYLVRASGTTSFDFSVGDCSPEY